MAQTAESITKDPKPLGSRGPKGPPPAYQVWKVVNKIYDADMNLIDEFVDIQETAAVPPNFYLRRTRELPDGSKVTYEDRGQVNQKFTIVDGTTGFGGKWGGQVFMDGWVYTNGTGGKAEFQMVNTHFEHAADEAPAGCCLRILDVKEPVQFLTAEPLQPGRYYLTTEECIIDASNDVPDAMLKPL